MKLEVLPGLLLPWYRENRRELPWRQTADPYRIWVSEIMLQQTRVEAVKGYYARFLDRLPDIAALAHCDDDELHKLWEGLGYYSRVRNLKKAARVIEERHGGLFPSDHAAVPGSARHRRLYRRSHLLHRLLPAHPGGGRQRAARAGPASGR